MMTIHFSHPQYLWLLPLAWAFTWWVQRSSLADLGRARGYIAMGPVHCLLTLLIFAWRASNWCVPRRNYAPCSWWMSRTAFPSRSGNPVLDYIHEPATA